MANILPRGLAWYPAAFVVLMMLCALWTKRHVLRMTSIVGKTRVWLNDWTLVDRRTKRLYVYSVKDVVVRWRDVEAHIG